MDPCPLCAGDVVYVGLTRVECASVGCPNHRPAPPRTDEGGPERGGAPEASRAAGSSLTRGPDPDDDELELWLSSFVFF